MSVRTYAFTFDGSNKATLRGGDFFAIEELTSDVSVRLKDEHGNEIGFLENIGAGFWIAFPASGSIEIESSVAQSGNFVVGDGRFGTNKTTTSINGGQLTPRTLVTSYTSFYSGTVLQTIITPAANTDGVRIDSLQRLNPGGAGRVMCKSSAPSAWNDTAARTLAISLASTNNMDGSTLIATMPYIVPAGEGLYHQNDSATVAYTAINYEVL